MNQTVFVTSNLDLALTKFSVGVDVAYTGPHQGVFRFESVKLAALRAAREARPDLLEDAAAAVADLALRRFLTLQ